MTIFLVTISSAGSPNPIKIPANAKGERNLDMYPPVGHAWTQYDAEGVNNLPPWNLNQPSARITRIAPGQTPFVAGETVASANLDSGSGSLICVLS
jgi:hypothetical protein